MKNLKWNKIIKTKYCCKSVLCLYTIRSADWGAHHSFYFHQQGWTSSLNPWLQFFCHFLKQQLLKEVLAEATSSSHVRRAILLAMSCQRGRDMVQGCPHRIATTSSLLLERHLAEFALNAGEMTCFKLGRISAVTGNPIYTSYFILDKPQVNSLASTAIETLYWNFGWPSKQQASQKVTSSYLWLDMYLKALQHFKHWLLKPFVTFCYSISNTSLIENIKKQAATCWFK